MKSITLNQLQIGDTMEVKEINNKGSIRRRFLDIGLIPGTRVKCIMKSPGGDLVAYMIKGALIAIRTDDSKGVVLCG